MGERVFVYVCPAYTVPCWTVWLKSIIPMMIIIQC